MSTTATACDWNWDRRVSWLWPAAFVVVGAGWLVVPDPWGAFLAAAGFAVAGALCVGNTLRCRRTHCAITGPLYLVAGLLFLARAGGLSVPASLIVAFAVVGTTIAFVPEWLGARYLGAGDVASILATTGTLLGAGLVAACCLGPTLFVLFGATVASLGTLGALEPYRPLFLLAGLACWGLAYHQHRRRALCEGDACGTPASRRGTRTVLWGSLVLLLVAASYPYAVASFVG
jgi:mercuric ion transport protein